MKNYVITSGNETKKFRTKKEALKALKRLEKAGIPAELLPINVPSNSFIETMRYYYSYFLRSECTSIYDAYGKPSAAKVNSFKALEKLAVDNVVKVLGHNCMKYTAAMIYQDTETGELLFRIDTKDKVKTIPLNYVS